jgi:hypothetical protein
MNIEYKKITIQDQDLSKYNLEIGQYQLKRIEEEKELCKQISKYVNDVTIEHVITEIISNEGMTIEYCYEHQECVIKYKGLEQVIKGGFYKEYYLICPEAIRLLRLYNDGRDPKLEGVKEPNKIGVLTTKKITDWLEYNHKVVEKYQEKEKEIERKIKEFLAQFDGEDMLITKRSNDLHTSGSMEKNGLRYTFEITESGYIHQEITFSYKVNNTFENFKKLSENKYV